MSNYHVPRTRRYFICKKSERTIFHSTLAILRYQITRRRAPGHIMPLWIRHAPLCAENRASPTTSSAHGESSTVDVGIVRVRWSNTPPRFVPPIFQRLDPGFLRLTLFPLGNPITRDWSNRARGFMYYAALYCGYLHGSRSEMSRCEVRLWLSDICCGMRTLTR
jgi:hypothetical protein